MLKKIIEVIFVGKSGLKKFGSAYRSNPRPFSIKNTDIFTEKNIRVPPYVLVKIKNSKGG